MPPQTNPNTGRPIFGGPDDGRSTPTRLNDMSYQDKIDHWKDKIQSGKGNTKKLRKKIQGARVERWQDKVDSAFDEPVAKDAQYVDEVTAANKQYGESIIGAGMQESATRRDYGLDQAYQEGGAQFNPYSKAAQLQQAWEVNKRKTLNEYASAGQLYSGARQNAVNSDQANYTEAYQSAEDAMRAQLEAINAERLAAGETQSAAVLAAEESFGTREDEIRAANAPGTPKFIDKEKKRLQERKQDTKSAPGKKELRKLLEDVRDQKGNSKKERKQVKKIKNKMEDALSKKQRKRRIKKISKKLGALDPIPQNDPNPETK